MYRIKNKDVISADLLSVEEVGKLPKWVRANGDWWWLCSPGKYSTYVMFAYSNGYVSTSGDGVDIACFGVRPTLQISNLPKLEVGDLVEVFGLKAQYIENDSVLLCNSIFCSRFDKQSNVYETSGIKKRLDEWFKDMQERRGDDGKLHPISSWHSGFNTPRSNYVPFEGVVKLTDKCFAEFLKEMIETLETPVEKDQKKQT